MAKLSRRTLGFAIAAAGIGLVLASPIRESMAQEQAPNRPEFTIVAKDFHFAPDTIEVTRDDVVKVTIRSEDVPHSFSIDEYRIVKRVPAGGSTTFEFRADRVGTFPFYCNLTNEAGHAQMRGQLVVRAR